MIDRADLGGPILSSDGSPVIVRHGDILVVEHVASDPITCRPPPAPLVPIPRHNDQEAP